MLPYREWIYVINHIHQLFQFLLHADKQFLVRDSGFLRLDVTLFLAHMTLEKQLTFLRNVLNHSSKKSSVTSQNTGTVSHIAANNLKTRSLSLSKFMLPVFFQTSVVTGRDKNVQPHCVRSEVITEILLRDQVFWDVTSCRLVNSYRHSKEHSASSWIFLHKPLDYISQNKETLDSQYREFVFVIIY
jgi:hypothetical protein